MYVATIAIVAKAREIKKSSAVQGQPKCTRKRQEQGSGAIERIQLSQAKMSPLETAK
jgi:hypothetical protein